MAEHIEVFNHPHNWSTPLVENYEFKTDIVTSQSGREQRRPFAECLASPLRPGSTRSARSSSSCGASSHCGGSTRSGNRTG